MRKIQVLVVHQTLNVSDQSLRGVPEMHKHCLSYCKQQQKKDWKFGSVHD